MIINDLKKCTKRVDFIDTETRKPYSYYRIKGRRLNMIINKKIKDVIEKHNECNKIEEEIYEDIEKMFDDEGAQKLLRNAYLKKNNNGFLYVIILHYDIFLRINFLIELQNYFGVKGNIVMDNNDRKIIFDLGY